jgi:alpha,alpha-trehalose phosphorylase
VIKQTDVVLATYLVEHAFDEEETRRTFDYYDPLTTGDSTLSACIQSVISSAVGYPEAALDYFLDACAVDLLDVHDNTADGIHIASAGGTWLALVAGFGGLRESSGRGPRAGGRWSPRPHVDLDQLPAHLEAEAQALPLRRQARREADLAVEVRHEGEAFRLRPGAPVSRPAAAPAALPDVTTLLRAA